MKGKRYRLKSKNGNMLSKKRKKMIFSIPVTENDMSYEECHNISSKETGLNAILIRIKGSCNLTPKEPVVDSIKGKINLKKKNFDIKRLKEDPLMLVCIYNNCDKLSSAEIEYFKCLVSSYDDYPEATIAIRGEVSCGGYNPNEIKDGSEKKPREQDGDVIGGNG